MRFFVFLLMVVFFTNCKVKHLNKREHKSEFEVNKIQQSSVKLWHQKDNQQDTIPGISLDKWYSLDKKKPKNKNIVVAVIDTQIDLKHEDLLGQIWNNTKEVANNGIDDDNNGYTDDSNGWNFIGTKGGSIVWSNFEYVRIVREYEKQFKNSKESEILNRDLNNYKEFIRAFNLQNQQKKFYGNWFST